LVNVALVLEYEAVCLRPEHLQRAGLAASQALAFVDAIAALVEPVHPYFVSRPQLHDPNDEMVLEAAVNGQAHAIINFNHCDFGAAPARFGIELLLPCDLLRRLSNR
jgi:predicted nucleic acid-binding protein